MQTELASLREEFDAVRTQLREVLKLNELMRADLDRRNDPEPPPHKPERVPPEQLQLAMARVLAESGAEASGNDDGEGDDDEDAPDDRDPPRDAGGARPARSLVSNCCWPFWVARDRVRSRCEPCSTACAKLSM